MSEPLIAWLVLIVLALSYETYALRKGGGITLSEGVWGALRFLAKSYPYTLVAIGFLLGSLYGHFFWCPCAIR